MGSWGREILIYSLMDMLLREKVEVFEPSDEKSDEIFNVCSWKNWKHKEHKEHKEGR
jgi:hypothetical protein